MLIIRLSCDRNLQNPQKCVSFNSMCHFLRLGKFFIAISRTIWGEYQYVQQQSVSTSWFVTIIDSLHWGILPTKIFDRNNIPPFIQESKHCELLLHLTFQLYHRSRTIFFFRFSFHVDSPGFHDMDVTELGIPTMESFIKAYFEKRGLPPVDNLDFYISFSFFRLAAIAQGVYKRALQGNKSLLPYSPGLLHPSSPCILKF